MNKILQTLLQKIKENGRLIAGIALVAAVVASVSVAEKKSPAVSQFLASVSDQAAPAAPAASAPAPIPATRIVNINTAGSAELTTLRGIGDVKAAAIIDYRNAKGPFYRIEDITNVSGIGPAVFEDIRDRITVGDISPPPAPLASPAPSPVPPPPPPALVPAPESAPAPAPLTGTTNINTAGKAELMTLKGIGDVKADAIIDYRNTQGSFYKIEDIMNVSGIGPAVFEDIRDRITVGDISPPPVNAPESALAPEPLVPASPSPEPTPPPAENTRPPRVLIAEVMAGKTGSADYEFIVLYNAGGEDGDLTGWSVKKKSSTGTESSLVVPSRLNGKVIAAGKYLLLANEGGYTGGVSADVPWPSSYALAYKNNALTLYDKDGNVRDAVSWSEIPADKGYARVSWESNEFGVKDAPTPKNSRSD